MLRIVNSIRPYVWGSPTLIPQVLGIEPTGKPMAELWLGAHPGSPSLVDGKEPLNEVIAKDPVGMLGEQSVQTFGPELPYLMKLLAAARPLSLQVHPTSKQAQEGFAAEQEKGIPVDDPARNYKDPRHKPEVIIALTQFDALSGFRAPSRARSAFVSILGEPQPEQEFWSRLAAALSGQHPGQALQDALTMLLAGGDEVTHFVTMLAEVSFDASGDDADLVRLLNSYYPGDPGIAAALLLNRVRLAPGEALFSSAGTVHAYLSGLGVEVMASSDNVLRGGLTPKHIDVPELCRIVNFEVSEPYFVKPVTAHSAGVERELWVPPTTEFEVQRIRLDPDAEFSFGGYGACIALVLEGEITVDSEVMKRADAGFFPSSEGFISAQAGHEGATVFVTSASFRED